VFSRLSLFTIVTVNKRQRMITMKNETFFNMTQK
jgi:hypothetical protein